MSYSSKVTMRAYAITCDCPCGQCGKTFKTFALTASKARIEAGRWRWRGISGGGDVCGLCLDGRCADN